jgi:Domain of unknown function (DUF4405)
MGDTITGHAPHHPASVRPYARAVIAIALFLFWGIAALSGILLGLAPIGPRSGQIELLLGLTKSDWGDVHFWTSIVALGVTAVHIIVDWRALCGCMRYLASPHRDSNRLGRRPDGAVVP